MKLNLVFLGVVGMMAQVATAGVMTRLPDGSYQGKGDWYGASGHSGAYMVVTKIESNELTTSYQFDNQKETLTFHVVFDSSGTFVIEMKSAVVGKGYCMSTQCHYSIQSPNVDMEETITFFQGHLYKLGSKTVNGEEVHWEEAMNGVNSGPLR